MKNLPGRDHNCLSAETVVYSDTVVESASHGERTPTYVDSVVERMDERRTGWQDAKSLYVTGTCYKTVV